MLCPIPIGALCHKPTYAAQQIVALPDHLVGNRKYARRFTAQGLAALIICSWVAAAMLLGRGQNCNARKRRDKLRQKLETLGEGLITS